MTTVIQTMNDAPAITYRKNYQPPVFFIDDVHLHFDLYDHEAIVRSRLRVRHARHAKADTRDLFLNGDSLQLVSLTLNGEVLPENRYSFSSSGLTINDMPDACELIITTRIFPQKNTALSGLYRSGKTFCTQCEAEGFRRITYYLDHPDVLSRFTTTIEADLSQYPVLLSNGNPIDQGVTEHARHWVTWEDPFKKPSYLFALVAGDFDLREDVFITKSNRTVALRIYAEKGMGDQTAHAMHCIKEAMRWDEQVYGREYDLDIFMVVAISDFNMGAMENKGLNIFNTKYVLAKPATATDDDYIHILSVIGHEYFHNWTGNRITCRDWFQLSLKEGLTIFRDQSFSQDVLSRSVMRIRDVNELREAQFPEDASPLSHPVRPEAYLEIDNFYTATVYNKGAEVLRMLQTILGVDTFHRGMDAYFIQFDGQAVTIEDFIKNMEEVSGKDLTQFRLWYSQSGTPIVNVSGEYHAATQSYTLKLVQHTDPTQDQTEKHPLHIPIRLGLWSENGESIPLQLEGEVVEPEKILHLTEKEQSYTFHHVASCPTLSLLRGFSAPVKLKFERSASEQLFLMEHDKDTFNRYESAQQLMLSMILHLVSQQANRNKLEISADLGAALMRLLQDSSQDPFLLSEIMQLPSEKYIGEQMDVVAVEGIHVAREFVMRQLAVSMRPVLLEQYERLQQETLSRDFDIRIIGKRALKNRLLSYLTYLPEGQTIANQQLNDSLTENMTDAISALSCLNHFASPLRQPALDVFYTVWQDDLLVVDKWLAMQAVAPLPTTLEDIKFLTEHSAFDWKNPNKVYALIGQFGSRNPICFHQKEGAGYVFLREAVQKLNELNPNVAARMVKPLTRWKRYDKERQVKMIQALTLLKETPNLSVDVYELVTKSLEKRAD